MLDQGVARIKKLTDGWEDGGTASFVGLLEDFRKQFRAHIRSGEPIEQCTRVKRGEWLFLSLYLNDLGAEDSRTWLPPLDNDLAISILGQDPSRLKKHIRRLLTQLYFTHFGQEKLPCLEFLCGMLKLAWQSASQENLDPISKVWSKHAHLLFAIDAPDRLAEKWLPGMSVHELANAYYIQENGEFRKELIKSLILNRLRNIPIGMNNSELNELVISAKEQKVNSGGYLGAAAVKILINRSQKENSSRVPADWKENLVTFACDPRIPNTAMQAQWWSWATSTEKDVAIRAIGELNMLKFIGMLEESLKDSKIKHQFPSRKRMLLRLFELGMIQDVRLVVASRTYDQMDPKTRGLLLLNWVAGGSSGKDKADTSFICMKCVDNVYLIEATGSFGLRGFIGSNSFPIDNFWNSQPKGFYDDQLRINRDVCPVYQVHHTGNWLQDFVYKLSEYNIEWRRLT
jgi:hypothetical protein